MTCSETSLEAIGLLFFVLRKGLRGILSVLTALHIGLLSWLFRCQIRSWRAMGIEGLTDSISDCLRDRLDIWPRTPGSQDLAIVVHEVLVEVPVGHCSGFLCKTKSCSTLVPSSARRIFGTKPLSYDALSYPGLTHSSIVMSYGSADLCPYWFRKWLVAC